MEAEEERRQVVGAEAAEEVLLPAAAAALSEPTSRVSGAPAGWSPPRPTRSSWEWTERLPGRRQQSSTAAGWSWRPESTWNELWGSDPTSSCGEQPAGRIGASVCGVGSWRRPDGAAEGFLSERETRSDGDKSLKKSLKADLPFNFSTFKQLTEAIWGSAVRKSQLIMFDLFESDKKYLNVQRCKKALKILHM